jgi:putative hemolysin
MVAMIALVGCTSPTTAPSEEPARAANPASVHCVDQGGKLEMRKGPDGETGYCHLPDGSVVEEWELYRSQTKDGDAQ